ncbi:hypothetical protein [Bradyrhizobium zhanjiangense]|uniref:hypothetical protein n=1 Tax=Bradyrhizobium zhanjiangense TaxID=1325107 RepID=UPI0013E8C8D8|nr:hypothetical protein [Bradyrhizobium zhanjiangense]
MRESSHFDGHQTTGYNQPKNIIKLEVLHRIDRCVVIEWSFREATGAGRKSAGMSTIYQFAVGSIYRIQIFRAFSCG